MHDSHPIKNVPTAVFRFKQVDNRLGQAHVQRGLGDLESTLGRNDAARAAYAVAAEFYGALNMVEDREDALTALRKL